MPDAKPMSDERWSEINLELLRFSRLVDPSEPIKMLLELRNENDRLRSLLAAAEAVATRAEHKPECVCYRKICCWKPCDCGFQEVKDKWQSLRGGA